MAEIGIIGAGVAGLTAAYQLRRSGHTVTVLEGKPQAGGLSTTVRRGDVIAERDENGAVVHQTVNLDRGQYVNAGPGRLPHHHRRILRLCQQLGVDLEPYIMSSDANYYVDARTGGRYRRRRIENDARGWLADLAYSDDDPRRLRELVTAFGDLHDGRYVGTPRAGDGDPIPLSTLAALRFCNHRFWQPLNYLWQDVMFQPVGGMDRIWRALRNHVSDRVVYNAAVEQVTTSAGGGRIQWRRHGQLEQARFDWVLSTVPFPLLADIRLHGFDGEYRRAVEVPGFAAACKVGWQSESRWWENDENQIYGGISYTNDVIQQFWYPSTGQCSDSRATLTGAYAAYEAAERLGRLPVDRRIARARIGGARIHREVADEDLLPTSKALAVAWHRVPFQAGGWCHWEPDNPHHGDAFATLARPAGRFVAIGDQISSLPGWQEGCVESVQRAIGWIDGTSDERGIPDVPDSRQLTVADHPGGEVYDEEGEQ